MGVFVLNLMEQFNEVAFTFNGTIHFTSNQDTGIQVNHSVVRNFILLLYFFVGHNSKLSPKHDANMLEPSSLPHICHI